MSNADGFKAIMNEPSNEGVLRKLVITTIAMMLVPIITFFLVRHATSGVFLFFDGHVFAAGWL
jgi:prepilin-type processing-associated H-X9-DG protein